MSVKQLNWNLHFKKYFTNLTLENYCKACQDKQNNTKVFSFYILHIGRFSFAFDNFHSLLFPISLHSLLIIPLLLVLFKHLYSNLSPTNQMSSSLVISALCTRSGTGQTAKWDKSSEDFKIFEFHKHVYCVIILFL